MYIYIISFIPIKTKTQVFSAKNYQTTQKMDSNELSDNDKNRDHEKHGDKHCNIQHELPTTSEQSQRKNPNKSFDKLTFRSKVISDKLKIKRQQLELQALVNIEANNAKMIASDKNAFKVLKTMTNGGVVQNGATQIEDTQSGASQNQGIQIGAAQIKPSKPNRLERINLQKPLKHQSKQQLEDIVKGFHRLILDLTLDNKKLKDKVKIAAAQISGLKDFPIFPTDNESIGREKKVLSNQNGEKHTTDSKVQKTVLRENEKQISNLSQAEKFSNYINKMLRTYIGKEQEDKLKKYKCLPAQINDLEPFANALVEEGYGCIVEKEIRINRKNNLQAFISMTSDREASIKDAIITAPFARRYAFEGDIVRAFVLNADTAANKNLKKLSSLITEDSDSLSLEEVEKLLDDIEHDTSPESEVNDAFDSSMAIALQKDNCRKAFVIKIVKQTELREVVGSISFMHITAISSELYYKLTPHDARMPMVFIHKESCAEEIKTVRKEDVCGMIYVARILDIDFNGHCIGELVQPVGKAGNLQAEIKAILLHNGLRDTKPYEQKYNDLYEAPMASPSDEDLKSREDLRQKCVFTIDPLTAKDLDDAVSIEKVSDFEYEIGVHISDVSFYLKENSELDNIVKERTTSIYLVNEVIHMLPTSLCLRCSLLPGEDKFTFSVFWKWHTEKDEISAPRFTRSIINSCSQFAYEHAQKIIDNPNEELGSDDIPNVLNDWKPNDIKWRVLVLHKIAQKLKAKRFENGALAINNPKLRFQIDPKTGEPLSCEVEGRQEANFLIEEFMLLANQSVARFIHDNFPDTSILRIHSPPLAKSMKVLKERLANVGLDFDISSSKGIYESMQRLINEADDHKAVETCLNALLVKPMARARYICSEGKSSDADFWHFALSTPIYTHFTSPIRRYPDILVHRLLAAALNYCPPPQRTPDELHHLAKICNDQKLNAKNASDESIDLFFKRYLQAKKSLTLKAVVTEMTDNMTNVVTIETGHTISILYKEQNCLVNPIPAPTSIEIFAEKSGLQIKLQLFSTIDVNIVLRNEKICGFFAMPGIQEIPVIDKNASKKDKYSKNNNVMDGASDTPTTSSKSKKKSSKRKESKEMNNGSFYALED